MCINTCSQHQIRLNESVVVLLTPYCLYCLLLTTAPKEKDSYTSELTLVELDISCMQRDLCDCRQSGFSGITCFSFRLPHALSN